MNNQHIILIEKNSLCRSLTSHGLHIGGFNNFKSFTDWHSAIVEINKLKPKIVIFFWGGVHTEEFLNLLNNTDKKHESLKICIVESPTKELIEKFANTRFLLF